MRPRSCLVVCTLVGFAVVVSAPLGRDAEPRPSGSGPGTSTQVSSNLPGIVFVGAPIFDEKTDGGEGVYQGSYHWRDSYLYARSATYHRGERTMGPVRPGRNLYSLVPARPDGKLTRLTHLKSGAVFKPEPSFDGTKVLFALQRDEEDWFHLYEVNVSGTGLRQLTDGPFNDFAGTYLPDGRIVFCSDRTGYLEEYHEERTETLFVMNGDGTGIQQLTFLPGTYFEPSLLCDGRIMFSFWDAFHIDVPPFDKHETYLMTVNPDGTEERHLFGAGQYRFFNRERHSGVGLTQAREMPDGRILVQSEMGPSILDLRAGLSVREALAPVFPGTTSILLGGTTHRVHLSPLGTRSTAHPLQDGRFLFSATLPGARDSGIYVCDPATRGEHLVLNIPNYAEFDAVPVLVERPRPNLLPSRLSNPSHALSPSHDRKGVGTPPLPHGRGSESPTTRFLVVAGRDADNPKRAEALKRARFFRVVEAEYTGVTTSSHTNLETRILGVVPILPDGSAYFEAPADTPIFLDPLDAAGNRVLMEWNYPNTAVETGLPYPATQMAYMSGRAGETKACYGCHATQTNAVPNTTIEALKYGPVKIARESTDIQYRRNEPEAYRRQARISEAAKYRSLLASTDPALRARACTLLMNIEEGAQKDVAEIAGLLKDESVEVRRAAALALTRLGTLREKAPLTQAWKDRSQDPQVRFAAAAAIEAMGEIPEGWEKNDLYDATDLEAELAAIRSLNITRLDHEKELLTREVPLVSAIRAAGKRMDAGSIKHLVPCLRKHEYEYQAAEAAVALGRIATPEAVAALWDAVRSEVPNRKVHISRYLQHGPRPEEYALLKGLILADARVEMWDVHLLIAILPNTFMEKPRFEDRLRAESQRVLLPRLLLDKAGLRQRIVEIVAAALRGEQNKENQLYQQIVKGINLERPFSEHGRPFPVVGKIGPEESLWLLSCLLDPEADLPKVVKRPELEALVVPFLTSQNHRERIDAAVLLGITGFGGKAAEALATEIAKPYSFPEIASMGKGMPDDNFRDKSYLVMALAKHINDVGKLQPFADPRTMTRDVRYGLTHGLAFRRKADGIPLLIEMATRDPITLVRQQARYGLSDIQDACLLAGKTVPEVNMPEPLPLEALYPPRGLSWADTTFVEFERVAENPPADGTQLGPYLEKCLTATHFHDLNMAQAAGARYMMITGIEETRLAFARLAKLSDDVGQKSLRAALDSPYPFAHYLAFRTLAERGEKESIPLLLKKVDTFSKGSDTAGFWWCCEALGLLQAREALPVLSRHATATNPPGTFGPEGMATGYIAAKALAQIAADPKHPEVSRCLAGDNIWLRAGALRGLAEARAPGTEELLRKAAAEENPAVVRYEAQVQLRRWRR